jgi:hypothetical protein
VIVREQQSKKQGNVTCSCLGTLLGINYSAFQKFLKIDACLQLLVDRDVCSNQMGTGYVYLLLFVPCLTVLLRPSVARVLWHVESSYRALRSTLYM